MPAQDELVASCTQLVQRLARRYAAQYSGASMEDLASEGYVGLLQAAQKFQPKRGVQFSTFAVPRIRGAMIDLLRRESPLSRPMARQVAKMKSEQDLLWARLGREPTQDELEGELKLSHKKASEVFAFRSLHVMSLEDQADELGSYLPDRRGSPEDTAIRTMIRRELNAYLARLQDNDREILERIYWYHQKHVEVAADLGISPSRVSQRRARALKRMRQMLAEDGLEAAHYLQVA
jgi:RNA polymerase sigma factor for flagellar operon FliA